MGNLHLNNIYGITYQFLVRDLTNVLVTNAVVQDRATVMVDMHVSKVVLLAGKLVYRERKV